MVWTHIGFPYGLQMLAIYVSVEKFLTSNVETYAYVQPIWDSHIGYLGYDVVHMKEFLAADTLQCITA